MSRSSGDHQLFTFGQFTLDIDRGTLLRSGLEIKLRPKSYELLRFLVEHPGRLIEKHQLLDAVWGTAIVTDGSITQCLIDIRRALDDADHAIIRTVARRGYIFEAEVVSHRSDTPRYTVAEAPPHIGRKVLQRRLVLACSALVAMTVVAWVLIGQRAVSTEPGKVPDGTIPRTIAVLPFVDLSPQHDQAWIADGIAEEIIDLLARTPGLQVISRTSSFSFRDRDIDIATVASRLDVIWVLEGSVSQQGDRIRISAQLIDARNSTHTWSQIYERRIDDVLDVRAEIAIAVAGKLRLKLSDTAVASATTSNARAFESLLQARFLFNRRGQGDLEAALQHFQQSVQIDPDYALAWAGIAGVYSVWIADGHMLVSVGEPIYRRAIEQALSLGPTVAEVQVRAAQYYGKFGPADSAIDHWRRALLIDPDNALVLASLAGKEAEQGKFDQAVALQRRSLAVDPLSASERDNLGAYLLATGRIEDARAEFRKAAELNPSSMAESQPVFGDMLILERRYADALALIQEWPDGPDKDRAIAMVGHDLGLHEEARQARQRLVESIGPDAAVSLAEVDAFGDQPEMAFRWLDTALQRIGENPAYGRAAVLKSQILTSPFLLQLHAEPGWRAMNAQWAEMPSATPSSPRTKVPKS